MEKRTKPLTINKFRGYLYKGAKYLGDAQAVLGISKALQDGKPNKALNIAKGRVATRVGGKFTGRGLGYMRKQASACFIATAVYENENTDEVQVLRQYRDNVLMNFWLGRKFIDLYYSGLGEKLAYLLERDWKQTIPAIKKGLDYLVQKYSTKFKQEVK